MNNQDNCPKVLAVYLPQFYETEHNNNWWGEGFTDWVTLKKSNSYFSGHCQPEIPLNYNYYNLSSIDTMQWQAELAKKYGIDGFVFYHYYFGDGHKELELPAENLLKHPEVEMPFCFSWANPSWVRTWSKISGEFWGEQIEKKDKDDDGVMIMQDYGDKKVWKHHFDYLLPFFKDPRYIKIDGKPLFIFYAPSKIDCLDRMIKEWRILAKESGLKGLYIVGQDILFRIPGVDAVILSEPMRSIMKLQENGSVQVSNGVRCYDFSEFCETSLNSLPIKGIKTYFGGTCGYDTTPRRGKNGEILINNSPEIFKNYFIKLLEKNAKYSNAFAVVNAWNEWGEGMHLEPDERNEYSYLKCVEEAKKIVNEKNIVSESSENNHESQEEDDRLSFLIRRFSANREIYSRWIDLLSEEKLEFRKVLTKKGYSSVAIYGYGDLGRKLHFQLVKENVEVKYAIDQYVGSVSEGIKVYRKEEVLPVVDVIIVTAYESNAIKEELEQMMEIPIMTLKEMLEMI